MSGIELKRTYPVLEKQGIEIIHSSTLDLLRRVGVRIGTGKGLEMLKSAGANVDEKSMVARFPSALVEECIEKANHSVTLCARDPKLDAHLDFKHVHICNDGNGPLAVEFETGERRASTSGDLAKSALISNYLKNLHIYWPMVSSQDVDPSVIHLVDLRTSLINTMRHVQFATAVTVRDAENLAKIGAIVAGSYEELRRRPMISSVHTSIAPLQHDGNNMEAAFKFGEYGVPVSIFTMPIPGASGPVTLAGSLVVANAEFLSGLVLCQLANPGCSVIYGVGVAPLDMKTATRGGGGPEHGLCSAAVAQLAHHYRLPSLCGGLASTSAVPGTQAAMEKFASGLSVFLGGADVICGIGLLEDCRCLWLEQLFIEDEMISMMTRIAEGIEVSEERLALDVIEKVGIGGNFLGQRHTISFLPREHFIPQLLDRRSYDLWMKDGGRTMEERARQKVREVLKEAQPPGLPDDQLKEIDEIIEAARMGG